MRFYHVVKSFEMEEYSLLAVTGDCAVHAIDSFASLETFVKVRGLPPAKGRDEEALASLLVKIGNVSEVYGHGYSDGAGIIASAEEIQYRSPEEKAWVTKHVSISAPLLTPSDDGFVYRFFSREDLSTTEWLENTLEVHRDGTLKFDWTVLKYDVGLPRE